MPDYLNPGLTAGLARVRMPVIDATDTALDGYGRLVDDPKTCTIEIVRWRARGWNTFTAPGISSGRSCISNTVT